MVRKAIVSTASAALLLTAVAANAATVSGVVKSVDKARDAIQLTDGSAYTLAEGSEAEDFQPGSKVAIKFARKHGDNIASSVTVVK